MAEIINLRAARKAKARAEKETEADENRARFGRPRQEQMSTEATRDTSLSMTTQHCRPRIAPRCCR